MKTETFFTLFWIIYYPLCIGFYEDNIGSLRNVDELMTLILIAFTAIKYGRRTDNTCVKEALTFVGIIFFYVVYSLILAVNVSDSVWLDLVQQVRPYSVIYCTWILTPKFSTRHKRMMLVSMLMTLGAWLVTHYSAMANAEYPVLGQLAITTAMTYYLFTKPTKRNRWIVVGILTVGLLSGKMKFVSEYVTFIAILFFLKKKINIESLKGSWRLILLAGVIVFFTWERFDAYYVRGWENNELARPMTYKTSLKILRDYFPLGSGMGTFATNAAWKYYSPLYPKYGLDKVWGLDRGGGFICDAFYPSLAEFGVVGVFLFAVFWRRRLKQINIINNGRFYRVALMSTACLALESMADSSYLSGKGMGYFMLLGLCLASLKYQEKPKIAIVKEEEKNESDDGGLCTTEPRGSGIGHPNHGTDAAVERV